MLRPFILVGFLSGATGALANPVPLTGDDLKGAVSGSTVEIDTPLGTKVPMRFGTDGLVSAEAGVLAPVLGSAKDRGRWWVDGEKLCTKWFRWFDAGVRCLTIARDGARIHWRKIDDGETGTGTLVNWEEPKRKQKQTPAVVAKADPPVRVKPAPVSESKPAAVSEPEKRATRLAGPPREVPDQHAAPTPAPASTSAPTTVAQAGVAAAPDERSDEGPAMRFGGAGLLEASARMGIGAQATAPAPAPAAKAADGQPVRELPATAVGETAALQPPRSPERAAPANPPAKKPPPKADRSRTEASPATQPVTRYRVTRVHRSDVLNVRRGPSEEHAQIAYIPPTGREVEITGPCRAEWCPIRYGGITGWVHSYYLAEDAPVQGSASRVYVAKPY